MGNAVVAQPAAAQRMIASTTAHAVAEQVETPTPVVIVPIEVGTPVTITDGLTPNSVQIEAPPTQEIRVVSAGTSIFRGECTNPNAIFQGCPMAEFLGVEAGSQAERRMEERAIAFVLQQYGLPESARPLVQKYGRDEIRAALYGDIQEAFQTISYERSPDQQLLVDVYTKRVRETHLRAMQSAQNEYRRWRTDPCGYTPPPGFSYDVRSACIGVSQAFVPESPGLQAFVRYGLKQVYEDLTVADPRAGAAFVATSSGIVLLYGAAATGFAAAIGSQIAIPTSVLKVVAPYAVRSVLAVEGLSGGGSAATASMAGVLGILVATISTIVTSSMSIAREAEIPGQLQGMVDMAADYDVEWIMRNCTSGCVTAATADLRGQVDHEMYTNFLLTTLPDYPGTEPAPPAQPGDARLAVNGSPVEWMRYRADDKDGSPRAFRLGSGPWFVDRADGDGDNGARLTLQIGYRDAAGATWAVRRAGDQVIIVRTGMAPTNIEYTAPRQSAELSVTDPDGRTVTARIAK